MNNPGRRSPLGILASLAASAVFWFAFAPRQLGGWTTYVIVDGNSMEPRFRYGDLVLVRKQENYQVGDAVTYRNAEMGRFVFHRIVNVQAGRFVLQGDHNTWLDNYHPSREEIIGKLWIHIPSAGRAIQWAREPLHLAVGFGLIGGMMTASILIGPSRSRRGKTVHPLARGWSGFPEIVFFLTGFAALAFLGLSVFAFTRPLTLPAENLPYHQDVLFTYSAAGTPGVYDNGTIQAGEPIFPKLTCFLNVGLVYNITGNGLQDLTGNHQLYMRVFDEKSGWQRTIPLESETSFSGSSYNTRADLNLCEIESLAASMESQTGLHPSIYTLEVVARTIVMGNLGGQPLFEAFEPRLVFKFDDVHFHLEADDAQIDPLHATKSASIAGTVGLPNAVTFPGGKIAVQSLRLIALLGLALSVISLAAVGWYIFQGMWSSPANMIQMKYRGLLMNVHRIHNQRNLPVVDVASIDDLARLAERQNVLIAHAALNFLHCYSVQSNGTMYRYVVSDAETLPPELEKTLPRLTVSRNHEGDYLEAIPVDDDRYGYQIGPGQTHLLKKVKL